MGGIKRLVTPTKSENDVQAMKKVKLNCDSASEKDNFDFLFDDEDDFDLTEFEAGKEQPLQERKLDLSQWQRCIVSEIERDRRTFSLVLQVRDEQNDKNKDTTGAAEKNMPPMVATCYLQGPWSQQHISVGDLLSLLGVWDEKLNAYKVDNFHGMCVTSPDTLISGTTVVGSLFCRRKAVLQDKFRGVDANSKAMVIGSLVHELLQIVLEKQLTTLAEITAIAEKSLLSSETAFTLYASQMTREETQLEVEKFVPNIVSFVQHYVQGKTPAVILKDTFQGEITKIQDIEENLWVPRLGLKGKVDVSVNIHRRRNRNNALKLETLQQNTIPLELKTGRATFSMEHKGQLILYQMMLTAQERETRSGLLLYLREGLMREIQGGRNEQRDLIVLRNEIAHYLHHPPIVASTSSDLNNVGENKFVQPLKLPEPISHHSACGNCAYATICCTFAKTDPEMKLRDGHPLQRVMQTVTEHLKRTDYEYFMHWCSLLALEDECAKKSSLNTRMLWTETPETRQRYGRAVMGLQLNGNVVRDDGSRYLHSFQLKPVEEMVAIKDLTLCGFSLGDYVIVSSNTRLAIAAGCIYALTSSTISISLERNLCQNYTGDSFIIDKHDSQSSNIFNFTNLGLLLDDSERSTRLRTIVVERQPPTYSKVLPKVIATEGASMLKQLNGIQRQAVLKALTTESYMLIKGLPGTGKTQTLVSIVRLLHLMGKSILITSHTHSAVDNLLVRLLDYQLPMLRLGSAARLSPLLQAFGEGEALKDCHTESDLATKYASYPIVGATCLGSGHSIFLHRRFDYCIVDEATQVMQSTVLRPLLFSDKFILVGDPDQLPPLIKSKEARSLGADESMFQRLDAPDATSVLTLQYRMNKTITKLANELTYGGALKCATDNVKMATMSMPLSTDAILGHEKWLQRVFQQHIDMSVFLIDTGDCSERSFNYASEKHSTTCAAIEQSFPEDGTTKPQLESGATTISLSPSKQQASTSRQHVAKCTNYCDAAIIFRMLKALLTAGYKAERIGIITPYRAQVQLLQKLTAHHQTFYAQNKSEENVAMSLQFESVEVNTVDQYQGRDKDIIIYSCAKTGPVSSAEMERSRALEILEDQRRLTVAITRAKQKLILVGDAAFLQQYTPFRLMLSRIPSICKLQLADGKMGFEWQVLFDQLSDVISA